MHDSSCGTIRQNLFCAFFREFSLFPCLVDMYCETRKMLGTVGYISVYIMLMLLCHRYLSLQYFKTSSEGERDGLSVYICIFTLVFVYSASNQCLCFFFFFFCLVGKDVSDVASLYDDRYTGKISYRFTPSTMLPRFRNIHLIPPF